MPEPRLRAYLRENLRPDLFAGLTVAVMGVPQAMAYAMIAELPPIYGLYTAIVSCAVAALLGSSRHLVTGPTNALCMVLLSLTGPFTADGAHDPIQVILLLTAMAGLIQLGFGLLRLGGIVRYVSNSVVIGYTAGAGILIGANQLKNILGVDLSEHGARRFHEVIIATIRELPHANFFALTLGLLAAVLALGLPRLDRRIPGSLIAVVVAGGLAFTLGWSGPGPGPGAIEIVRDIQPIRGNLLEMFRLPQFVTAPDVSLVRDLLAGATAVALIGFLEAASIARTIAASSGQRLDFNRELIGQGTSKLVGSFTSCFASSGSFTRSAVNFAAGGKTRMAAVFSALWTALTVVLLAPFANYIPKAALAGILLVVAWSMVDKRRLQLTWRSGVSSRVVLSGTLGATLVLPLEYAIFVGVILSVVFLLRVTGRIDLTQLVPHPDSGFEELPFTRGAPSPVVTINMEGDLYFAAADDLDYELLRCIDATTRVVVLRMKRLRAAGSTAMAMLEHYEELLRGKDIRLVVCGIEEQLEKLMTVSGLRDRIGDRNIFRADNRLMQSTELACARAWSLVENERRRRGDPTQATLPPVGGGALARSLMSRNCIRFGHRHPLREALWLMSEMLKESTRPAPLPLFLQDRDGRLFGELSVWRILRAATSGSPESGELDDAALRRRMRERFELPIDGVARTELPHLDPDATLDELLSVSVRSNLSSVPISDLDGRLVGLLDPVDLLRGVARDWGLPSEAKVPPEDVSRTLIDVDASVKDALMLFLIRPDDQAPRTLVATDADGRFAGLFTPWGLLRGIAAAQPERPLAEVREEILEKRVGDVLVADVRSAPPGARLSILLQLLTDQHLEALPLVAEDGSPVGLVSVVDVFRRAADLALTPEDRGIRTDRRD